jgi:hypothetical protein
LQHLKRPSSEALTALVQAQLQPGYADAFVRATVADSPAQEFTAEFIKSATTLFEPVPSRLQYAKIFLDAINEGVIADGSASLLMLGTRKFDAGKMRPVPASLLSHYRPILIQLAETPLALSPLVCAQLSATLAGKIVGLPVPAIGPNGGLEIAWQVVAANLETAFDYAALLLMSDFAFQLQRCKLPTCHKLFLIERGQKQTQRKYCSENHRKEYLSADGKRRTYASRVGVTTKEWRTIIEKEPGLTPTKYRAEHKPIRRTKQRK